MAELFDFVKAASYTKENLFDTDDPDVTKGYSTFMINRAFSYFDDTLLFAVEMNMYPNVPPRAHFDYYRGGVRSRNRFAKWQKPVKSEDVKLMQEYYGCSPVVAEEYLSLYNEDELSAMREKFSKNK